MASPSKRQRKEDPAVTIFRDYLRIKTVHPDPDYENAEVFLKRLADDVGLIHKNIKVNDDPLRRVVIMTWPGQDTSLPSILLNSHTDVVPVFQEHWKVDAFSAEKLANGDIYARGTQDMKSVGIQYLEAIRRLKNEGQKFKRTIHLTFVPDEEVTGKYGMQKFVEHEEFKKLNIALALDEGLANPTDNFTVFYGERAIWWVRVKCQGNPGHGSRFIENNAAEKLRRVMNSFLDFRGKEEQKLKKHACDGVRLGDVTTINMTMVEGGVQPNVVPVEFTACFDIRIPVTEDLHKFENKIKTWCSEAGDDVTYEFLQKWTDQTVSSTDSADPFWKAFKSACDEMSMNMELEVFPAATDSRFIRAKGYNAIGFSPMNNTPILLHDHNEFLNEDVFLRGIDIYCKIIPALADVCLTKS